MVLVGSLPRSISKIRKIRVKRNTNRIASYLEVLPRAIRKIRKIRVKRNKNRIASYLEALPRAIRKIRKIRVKRNNAHRSATRCLANWSNLSSYHFGLLLRLLLRSLYAREIGTPERFHVGFEEKPR